MNEKEQELFREANIALLKKEMAESEANKKEQDAISLLHELLERVKGLQVRLETVEKRPRCVFR